AFVSIAAASFVAAQMWFTPQRAVYDLPESTTHMVFSINVITVAALVYLLATFTHVRAVAAQRDAAANADRVEYLANTDALTGLSNRRPLMDKLEDLSQSENQEYCVG